MTGLWMLAVPLMIAVMVPLVTEDALNLVSFGPDNVAGLMTREIDGENRLVTLGLSTGDATPMTNSPEADVWLETIPDWAANDTAFLPDDGGGMLIALAPVG